MNICKHLNQDFCQLHVHSEYSPQDAPLRLKEMVEYAKYIGYKAIAVSDHGTVSSWVKFQEICKKNGVKPIFGVEAYFTPDRKVRKSRKDNYHQLLLAKTNEGVKNIYRMTELAFSDGFYYEPRIDWDLLEQYHEGVICTSACVSGIISETYMQKGKDEALRIAERFRSIFGDDYYLEIQYHCIGVEESYLGVSQIAEELGINIVGTNDVHYLRQEDHNFQQDMMCLNMGRCIKDPKRLRHEMDQMYLKSPEEMVHIFGKGSRAVLSTLEIMDKCGAKIEMGRTNLPSVDIPKGMTDFEYLEQQSLAGLKDKKLDDKAEYKNRLEMELALVKKLREEKDLRFDRYFLVVADYVSWAWRNGIRVGVGRGSGAGSLILYCLRITGIDPLKYDLLFERFLAEDRIQMPDIDIDFAAEEGHKMFEYLDERYGRSNWARIGTIQKFHVASAIRAAYRVYDPGNTYEALMAQKKASENRDKRSTRGGKYKRQKKRDSFRDETVRMANDATKLLPRANQRDKNPDPKCTLRADIKESDPDRRYVYDHVPELKTLKQANPEMFAFAEHIEGNVKDRGIHAAGVLITEMPTIDFAPQQYSGQQKNLATAYDMDDIEKIGGIKFDFLQTKVLSVLTRTLKMIKARYDIDIPIDDLDPEDPDVLTKFAKGDTDGIFQFEGEGMKRMLRNMQPDCFEDIIAANALYRPGPMQYIEDFCDRKHGRKTILYAVDILKPILEHTYGVMVYQEQVMKIVRVLAGFTASESDKVRKGMGKKKKEILDEMKGKFIDGCASMGSCLPEVAHKIWCDMEKFASYAFNKSHAAGYSYTAYQCAYLKAYYPAEFMAAQLTVEGGDSKYDTVQKYEKSAKDMGIKLLPLDINLSGTDYTVVDLKSGKKAIRKGFKGVKGVGGDAYKDIKKAQPYRNMYDYCYRSGAGAKSDAVGQLIEAGAFDWLLPKLTERKVDGQPATRTDIQKEYESMMKRARAEHNVKGARKEQKEGIVDVFAAAELDEDDCDLFSGIGEF